MATGNKNRLFSYCVRYDCGAAPNPYHGICTLAICKPVIRRVAKKGDWIVGLGSANSASGKDLSKHVIYAMKVTEVLSMKEYDQKCNSDKQLKGKIPKWRKNPAEYSQLVGDCIYDFSKKGVVKQRAGIHNDDNREHDLGGEQVLLSNRFLYFGSKPKKLPKYLQPIAHTAQGHKSESNDPYIEKFIAWIEGLKNWTWNEVTAEPLERNAIENELNSAQPCSCAAEDRLADIQDAGDDLQADMQYRQREAMRSLADYHSAQCDVLISSFEHIQQIIGKSHHSLTEGEYTEILLRNFLRASLPTKYSVDTGFIRGNEMRWGDDDFASASPQIDILIHDPTAYAPIFRCDDLVIVLPDAVRGVIEVKKTLRRESLESAIAHIQRCSMYVAGSQRSPHLWNHPPFMGIFGFQSRMTEEDGDAPAKRPDSIYKTLIEKAIHSNRPNTCMPGLIVDASGQAYGVGRKGIGFPYTIHRANLKIAGEDRIRNYSLQLLLWSIMRALGAEETRDSKVTRIAMPSDQRWEEIAQIELSPS